MSKVKGKTSEQLGYWSTVFRVATQLMTKNPTMSGEHAYFHARNKVDEMLGQPVLELEIVHK